MNPTVSTLIPFEAALEKSILQKLPELRRAGVSRMALVNLRNVVTAPPSTLAGAPRGLNCIWSYAQIFESVARSNRTIRNFLLP